MAILSAFWQKIGLGPLGVKIPPSISKKEERKVLT